MSCATDTTGGSPTRPIITTRPRGGCVGRRFPVHPSATHDNKFYITASGCWLRAS